MGHREDDQLHATRIRRKGGLDDTSEVAVGGQIGLTSPRQRHARICQDEIDRIEHKIEQLPEWKDQLTLRGFIVGTILGLLFAVVILKLSLGSAGIVPSMNIPAGLISFALLKSWTTAGQAVYRSKRAPWIFKMLFQPFGVQENAVMQTFILSISTISFIGGFGTYLTGMDYQAYLNTGGKPEGDPAYDPSIIFNPDLHRIIPYLMLVSVLGVFMLTQLRKLMIVDWRLPFPSGTASGVMLTSFHTPAGEAEAMRKVRVLSWTGVGSFLFSCFKWLVSGHDYGCGFGVWPSFGFKALEYTWNFDWQHNYIGAGMICPHIVNWSMLLGAILSWGVMWPLMEKREGDWFPAGLDPHDFKGLFGYKVFLTIAILMGEGMYMVLRVMVSTAKDGLNRLRAVRDARQRPLPRFQANGIPCDDIRDEVNMDHRKGGPKCSEAGVHTSLLEKEDESEHLMEFKETTEERHLRTEVFLRDTIPWWIAPIGYGGLAILSTIFIPMIYPPVKWYYVLVAYVVTPLFALPNSYGAGLTDWDNCSMYGKLALFIFAAWAGAQGNGIIVGLGVCGVVFAATSSAATLMGDFRTGYICLAAPRAMFTAQLVGQFMGAIIAPLAFMLYYATGQVNVPGGPYPSPFSTIYRGMAKIGTEGFGALPKYCGVLMLTFFVGGMLLCLLRDLLPKKFGKFVPSPMAMGIPFYIGAASAINFWMGSLIMHIWEFINKDVADELGSTVGAGLLVGDGLWSIPSSIVAIAGKAPPICMGFYGKPMCRLPYCIGFWLGGSERVPAA